MTQKETVAVELTLKEVGKWLRERLKGERVSSITEEDIETLERGEMPK